MKVWNFAPSGEGNYVVVGGDWNQCPPDFDKDKFRKETSKDHKQLNILKEFLPDDWKWCYDPDIPTNRKLSAPYDSSSTYTTLIDFFLVSPNLKVEDVKAIDLDFQYSDHQPIFLKVSIGN